MIRRLNKKRSLLNIAVALLALGTAGCGNGNAPLAVLNAGDASLPQLNVPLSLANTSYYSSYFGSSTNLQSSTQFTFVLGASYISGYGQTITAIAPANGTIIDQTGTTITIQHSARLFTRISNVQGLVVRPGDYVTQGQQLTTQSFAGYNGGTAGFTFQVIVDGTVVCPWSYLSQITRYQLIQISTSGGYNYFYQGVCTQP